MPVEIDSVYYYDDEGRLVKVLFADGRGGFFDQLDNGLIRTEEAIRRARNDDPPGTPPEQPFKMPVSGGMAQFNPYSTDTSTRSHLVNPTYRYFKRVEKDTPKPLPAHHRIHGQRKGKERRW